MTVKCEICGAPNNTGAEHWRTIQNVRYMVCDACWNAQTSDLEAILENERQNNVPTTKQWKCNRCGILLPEIEMIEGTDAMFCKECYAVIERQAQVSQLHTFPSGAVRYPTGRRYDLMSDRVTNTILSRSKFKLLVLSLLNFDKIPYNYPSELCNFLYSNLKKTLSLSDSEIFDLYAKALDEGSKKYGDRNWEKGIPESNLVNHAIGHALKIEVGDTNEDHVAHLIWNVFAIIHFRLKDYTDELLAQ